jgi:hypothetical protein
MEQTKTVQPPLNSCHSNSNQLPEDVIEQSTATVPQDPPTSLIEMKAPEPIQLLSSSCSNQLPEDMIQQSTATTTKYFVTDTGLPCL